MIIHNNQTKMSFNTGTYSKQLISCAFVVFCLSTSASAMFGRFLIESGAKFSSSLPAALHLLRSSSANYMPVRTYHVKQSLTELEQYNILLQKALMGKSPFEFNVILKSAHAEGVDANVLNVARSLYVEPKKQEHVNFERTSRENSNTGC